MTFSKKNIPMKCVAWTLYFADFQSWNSGFAFCHFAILEGAPVQLGGRNLLYLTVSLFDLQCSTI